MLCDQVAYGGHPLSGGVERPPGLAVLDEPSGVAQLPDVSHGAGFPDFGVGLVEGSTDPVPQESGQQRVEVALGPVSVDAGGAEGVEQGGPALVLAAYQVFRLLGLLVVSAQAESDPWMRVAFG